MSLPWPSPHNMDERTQQALMLVTLTLEDINSRLGKVEKQLIALQKNFDDNQKLPSQPED